METELAAELTDLFSENHLGHENYVLTPENIWHRDLSDHSDPS